MFKTHIAFGFLFGVITIPYLSPLNQILFMALVMFGALLPDIDHPQSKLGSKFKIIGYLFEHRGFFHSFLVMPLIALLIYYFTKSYTYAIPLVIGYASHLVSDMITKEGIMPIHPFARLRLRGFIKTGGAFEYVIFLLVVLFAAYKTINL